ncbi:Protein trichome birefringence-like 31 [Linum grandiflorum]
MIQILLQHGTRQLPNVQFIAAAALAAILIVGTTRVVFDISKTDKSHIFTTLYKPNPPLPPVVFVSPEDRRSFRPETCNVFEGEWVWDNVTYPLYREESCPYLVKQTTCGRNGRPDVSYRNWRWEPVGEGCAALPDFDAVKLLDVLRGKRVMFVGDSVQRSQFESMVCMIQSVIPARRKSFHRVPPMKIFKALEWNVTIEYYWAPFIVESISDHATNHTVHKRLVNLDAISKHGSTWKAADVLIFESYVWWMHNPFINATYGSTEYVQEYEVAVAYKLAMETWANWVKTHINPLKQSVFFMSMSPTHLWNWEWGAGNGENCFNETYPIADRSYWGTGSNVRIMSILGDTIRQLQQVINVTFLNITQLSEYRKDGHTGIYGERKGKLLTREERSDPNRFADCIHWCLPGVPDTWNHILYAYLLHNHRN